VRSSKAMFGAILVLALSTFVSAAAYAKDDDAGEVRKAIEAANAQFSAAFARGDAKAVAAMYTADAVLLPPDTEIIRGTAAIAAFWAATMQSGVKGATLTTVDVGVSDDLAYETGKVVLTIQPEGAAAMTATAKYMVVWKKQADGSWKLHLDMWNNLPATK
jgi:uncharacterized protein (TIGR02246 family)